MTEKELELRGKASECHKRASELHAADYDKHAEEIRSLITQAEGYLAEAESLRSLAKLDEELVRSQPIAVPSVTPGDVRAMNVFFRSLRGHTLSPEQRSVLKASDVASGFGLTVPVDVQTKINKLIDTYTSLEPYVSVEQTKIPSGSRIIEKRSTLTAFGAVDEAGTIQEASAPQFEKIEYKVKKYGGILTFTSELLADTDETLEAYTVDWLTKKHWKTRNDQIVAKLKGLPSATITDVNSILAAIHTGLDVGFRGTTKIFTNSDGYLKLLSLKDEDGLPLLARDYRTETPSRLFGVYEVVEIPNAVLPTNNSSGNKAPFVIGDLKEAVRLFDLNDMTLFWTNTAAGAFETDVVKVRALERFDVQYFDKSAAVFGELAL